MAMKIDFEQHFAWLRDGYNHAARVEAFNQITRVYNGAEFEWGCNDCVHIIAELAKLLGVENPLKGVENYKTLRGARQVLKSLGFAHLRDAASAKLPQIDTGLLMPCDIVEIKGGKRDMDALCIWGGPENVWGFTPQLGFARFDMQHSTGNAWRLI